MFLARRARGLGALIAIFLNYPIPTLAFLGGTVGTYFGGRALIEHKVPEPKQKQANDLLGVGIALVAVVLIFVLSAKFLW